MVRLRRAERDHGVGAPCDGIAERELQLANLVADEAQRPDVIALQPNLDPQLPAQARRALKRGLQHGQLDTWAIAERSERIRHRAIIALAIVFNHARSESWIP